MNDPRHERPDIVAVHAAALVDIRRRYPVGIVIELQQHVHEQRHIRAIHNAIVIQSLA